MPPDYASYTDLARKAATIELAAVSFYDANHRPGARGEAIDHIEFVFIDGASLTVDAAEFIHNTDPDIHFSLRPAEDDA